MTEPSTGTGEHDPVAEVRLRVLDGAVYGDTGAQNGRGSVAVEALGDGGDVVDKRHNVFGEGAVDGVARELSVVAVLLAAVAALLAVQATTRDR